MIRTLLIIAGAGLVLSIACLGGAVALGGNDMARHGWAWTFRDGDKDIRIERVTTVEAADLGPVTSRTLEWTGGQALIVDDSLSVRYIQGDQPGVVVTGPRAMTDRVRLENGRLFLADGDEQMVIAWNRQGVRARSDRDELSIVVTAPDVVRFELNGSGDLSISGYDRPNLAVALSGSGEIEAAGRTDALDLKLSGSGDIDMAGLTVRDATVVLSGSGDIRVGPTGEASVSISGSGDVDLTSRPARLTTDISGSGEVNR